ncbi:MAG: TadE/TadG family type IV pilus assembly protein [Blastocatellia bacterium]
MRRKKIAKRGERGATLLEFTIGALVFFIALFGVLECSRLLWTHNALADAARRGARHAVVCPQNESKVRNVVVYGDPAGGAQPVVPGLTATDDRVEVLYTDFGVKQGTVSVRITGYQFTFAIPLIGTTLAMPDYQTTLTGESAGCLPPDCTTPSGC